VQRLVRREDERGTQPLPFAEQTVAHDFVIPCRRRQYVVDPRASVREIPS